MVGPNRSRPARFLAHPLPHLATVRLIRENNQMLEMLLGDYLVHLDPDRVLGNRVGHQYDNATLLSDSLKAILRTVDLLNEGVRKLVPSKLLNKKFAEVECLATMSGASTITCHFAVPPLSQANK